MDKQGLLNPQGLSNKRGALLAGALAGSILAALHPFFFEQMLAALVIFTATWVPLLATAFLLAVAVGASERGISLVKDGVEALPQAARRFFASGRSSELRQWRPEFLDVLAGWKMGWSQSLVLAPIEHSRRDRVPKFSQHRHAA